MIKISEATSIGIHAMVLLAKKPGMSLSTNKIAKVLHISEAHLSKILQRLAKSGLIRSSRGPKGGYSLNRDRDNITFLDVFEAISGTLSSNTCLIHNPTCNEKCIMGDLLQTTYKCVRDYLEETKISKFPDSFET